MDAPRMDRLMEPSMKKSSLILFASLAAFACSDGVAPSPEPPFDEAALLGWSASLTSDPDSRYLGHLHRLPDALALSAEQQKRIGALITAFHQATRADRDALAAISRRAREAAQAGKDRAAVAAILAEGDAIRKRLDAAEAKLRAEIDAVLTPEQRKWLADQDGRRCKVAPLTDQQRTQISALVAAFQEAYKTDLAIVQKALAAAREAQKAGASREKIAAILADARPAMARIKAGAAKLAAEIDALLTAEQKAARCYRTDADTGNRRG
jgi:Spy/CpxP family protein refolding chaperone